MKATAVLVLVRAFSGPACGAPLGLIPTKDVLTLARASGFGGLATRSYSPQGEWIYTRGFATARVE
jgi:hypothetical protein